MSMRLGLGLGLLCGGHGALWTPAKLFAGGEAGAWYDPSDLSTVWQDSARTTPGAVDSPVGAIDDKSGNGNHMTQATANARPILRQSGSLYYLERDGSNDELFTGADFTLQAGWMLSAAASYVAGADTATRGIVSLAASSTNYLLLGLRQSIEEGRSALRGASASPAVSVTTATAGSNSYPSASPAVIVSRFQALSHDIRVDGVTGDTEVTTWDDQTVASARFGFRDAGGGSPIAANLYAAVALQRVPTAAELDKLEAWLAGKAGVAL
jgi:hypothetical protein